MHFNTWENYQTIVIHYFSGVETLIKNKALELGFLDIGFAKIRKLDEYEQSYHEWLKLNYHGEMEYMERHIEERLNPGLLLTNAKTILVLIHNYYPQEEIPKKQKIAKYAWGEDYHRVIKRKLNRLLEYIKDLQPGISGRCFVDSAPLMERQWAQIAGMGWIGKNSLLLRKKEGSFFFISEILLDIELTPNERITSTHCGECTACIDACPTNAIVTEGVIDSNKCISHTTIESKNELTKENRTSLNGWIFGCDICQDVCPWNKFATPHNDSDFNKHSEIKKWDKSDWESLTKSQFKKQFRDSPVYRTGLEKLLSHFD